MLLEDKQTVEGFYVEVMRLQLHAMLEKIGTAGAEYVLNALKDKRFNGWRSALGQKGDGCLLALLAASKYPETDQVALSQRTIMYYHLRVIANTVVPEEYRQAAYMEPGYSSAQDVFRDIDRMPHIEDFAVGIDQNYRLSAGAQRRVEWLKTELESWLEAQKHD